jgi:hypothetical protein
MARKRPTLPAEFLRVSGVGEKKLEQYGEAMMSLIRQYKGSFVAQGFDGIEIGGLARRPDAKD